MGHSIAAFIVPAQVAESFRSKGLTHLHLIRLEQEFFLVPIIDAFLEEIDARYPADDKHYDEFWMFSSSLAALGADLSQSGPVAYVETDYDGGTGTQSAMAWKNGEIRRGPEQAKLGVINSVLYYIGAQRTDDKDAFESLGLDRYRYTDDWLEAEEQDKAVKPIAGPAPTSLATRLWRIITGKKG